MGPVSSPFGSTEKPMACREANGRRLRGQACLLPQSHSPPPPTFQSECRWNLPLLIGYSEKVSKRNQKTTGPHKPFPPPPHEIPPSHREPPRSERDGVVYGHGRRRPERTKGVEGQGWQHKVGLDHDVDLVIFCGCCACGSGGGGGVRTKLRIEYSSILWHHWDEK